MKFNSTFLAIASILILSLSMSCKTSQKSVEDEVLTKEEKPFNPYNYDLTQLLRRESGVLVNGDAQRATVSIRGNNSHSLSNKPLFIYNGQQIQSYSALYGLVDTNNIKSIRVLKDASETSFYGVRGTNGVIIITSK